MRDEEVPCCEPEFWFHLVISFALIAFACVTSGLSLGLLSHSKVELEVLIKSGVPHHQKNAAKVLHIVKNEYLLLCTLLIAKTMALEFSLIETPIVKALPVFLDGILPSWSAILVSMILVVAFGEVIPQAVCSRYGLSFGAKFALFVRVLLFILFPVSYPISKVLDWLLGENNSTILRRAELKTYVDLHGIKAGKGGDLTDDETTIISGAMNMTEKTARDAMTPISQTFSLDVNSKLDKITMRMIARKGHSRIPIYSNNPKNIIGLILVKNLIFYNRDDETPIKDTIIRRTLRVNDNLPLYDVLKLFQKGLGHMAVVVKTKKDTKISCQRVEKRSNFLSIDIDHSGLEPTNTEGKGIVNTPFDEKVLLNNSSVYPIDSEIHPRSHGRHVKQSRFSQSRNKWEHEDGRISSEELGSFESKFEDDEVIGIITMEDVLEELLQEEIMDETDQGVEIHSKVRVKFQSSRRSSSASSRVGSLSQFYWRTPITSPPSCYHTPIMNSPVSSPSIQPKLSTSPRKSSLRFSRSLGAIRSPPSSHQSPSNCGHASSRSHEHL